ncbi:MAG: DUF262 domain-containing protein [Lachnospiraceae bacterium]|nr:DUF262 domain-containing protein [Lachnospiraceae bacterium]
MVENQKYELEDALQRAEAEFVGLDYEIELENTEDDLDGGKEVPFNADKIRIEQQMLSLKYIMELIDADLMELNPGYERNRVWKDKKKKSLLIESLMLRIPIPAFYFYENKDTKFQVIDGQQRLATIHEFVNNKFSLTGMEYLSETCNRKYFKDLDIKYQQRIYRTQIAVNILDARSPQTVIFDIFRRINTGGMKLNPQEMRNAVCTPAVREFLKQSTKNKNFLIATRELVKDERMDAQELVLRFYAFSQLYDYEKCELVNEYSSISLMLDEAVEKLKQMDKKEFTGLYHQFDEAMRRCYSAFGDYCFAKITMEDDKIKLVSRDYINKSLFTAFSVIIMEKRYDGIDLLKCRERILQSLAVALMNPEYVSAITVATGDKSKVSCNFYYCGKVLKEGVRND